MHKEIITTGQAFDDMKGRPKLSSNWKPLQIMIINKINRQFPSTSFTEIIPTYATRRFLISESNFKPKYSLDVEQILDVLFG